MKRQPSLLHDAPAGQPRPFLESVARAYHSNFDDLSEFCFVFPNKRAGTFFLKHLQDASETKTLLAPFVTSITDFVADLADHDVASRIDLLFRLYNIYVGETGETGSIGKKGNMFGDFDSFRNWGETLLSDFSEVDQYDVDADSLFKNVKDYREIASSFLTEEQIEVMVHYFGYTPGLHEVERFWKNMEPPSDIKNKFLLLWQQMAPLYHALNKSLHAERLCTSGGAYRLALQRLRINGKKILPWKKIVIVGFNALSTTEALIFEELKSLKPEEGLLGDFAEFFWDGTGPILSFEKRKAQKQKDGLLGDFAESFCDGKDSILLSTVNNAVSFLKHNRDNFPSPNWAGKWIEESNTKEMPSSLTAIGAPSNAAQGKVAAAKIEELLAEKGEEIKEAKVAVVLPDENLLMPFLYGLPEGLDAVNLTMGYSLRITSIISFMYHLRRVRSTQRALGDDIAFYHEDLRMLLSHPYMHALAGSKTISEINGYLNHHHKITLTLSELRSFSEPAAEVLKRLPDDAKVSELIGYLDRVTELVSAALDSATGGVLKSRIDRSHIEVYRDALRRLDYACSEHGVEMGMTGVFSMVDKLLSGEQVTFEGEPLEGLQVMGLLETRALDFDRLIILSMNDRVMPRKSSGRTFIPDSLRHGYGLPYSNYREDLFSYYFYRMISRAREVTMIYDARSSSGMRSGGMSRYLMQLRYLYARDLLKFENHKFLLSPSVAKAQEVVKGEEVMKQLREFTVRNSKRNFSASALRNYFICPVKFFYENVMGLRADNDPSEYIDAIGLGNVVHEVMFHLYFPEGQRNIYLERPIRMEPEDIKKLIDDKEHLMRLVTESVNRLHFHHDEAHLHTPLDGAAALVGEKIMSQIKDVLTYDLSLAPFELIGGEISGLYEWPLPGKEFRVNMKYAIDRLDRITLPDGTTSYRIVDYKTGNSHVRARDMDAIFNGDENARNFFQLMLYANLMNFDRGMNEPVRLAIYQVSELGKKGETLPSIGRDTEPGKRAVYDSLKSHLDRNEEFLEKTNEILESIFDPEIPFLPADDDKKCQYCNLSHLCGRSR